MSDVTLRAGMVLFPDMTQLDLTGPFEVLTRLPGCRVEIVAKARGPVRTDRGLVVTADADFASAPQYDLLAVPGGPGTDAAILDAETVDFVRRQGQSARYIFGICTGSLLLGAAGLLRGRRAGGHWLARDLLTHFGAFPCDDRMVVDGHIYTSGGITAGIDMALLIAAGIAGEAAAQQLQLQLEYDPEPPFNAGTPFSAPPEIVARARIAARDRRAIREAAVIQAAATARRVHDAGQMGTDR